LERENENAPIIFIDKELENFREHKVIEVIGKIQLPSSLVVKAFVSWMQLCCEQVRTFLICFYLSVK